MEGFIGQKLSDFKFATPIDSPDDVLSEICGLEEYAAPEIRSHSRYGFPVDVWSLGCVINVSFLGLQTLKVIFDIQPMTPVLTIMLELFYR